MNITNVKKKNNLKSYSLNENARTLDLIEILSRFTPDIAIHNVSIDTNELEINATLDDSLSIFTIDRLNCNLTIAQATPELRGQLTDKMLIIKHLKTNSKSNLFTTDASTTTNTIITPAQTYKTSTTIMIITTTVFKNNNSKNSNSKNKKIRNTKKTVIALMKRQFTMKSWKYDSRKFEKKKIQIF